jgi:hypothetical protein
MGHLASSRVRFDEVWSNRPSFYLGVCTVALGRLSTALRAFALPYYVRDPPGHLARRMTYYAPKRQLRSLSGPRYRFNQRTLQKAHKVAR